MPGPPMPTAASAAMAKLLDLVVKAKDASPFCVSGNLT
jgi:hypothetical protein